MCGPKMSAVMGQNRRGWFPCVQSKHFSKTHKKKKHNYLFVTFLSLMTDVMDWNFSMWPECYFQHLFIEKWSSILKPNYRKCETDVV